NIILTYGLMGYIIVLFAFYFTPLVFSNHAKEGNLKIYKNMIGDSAMCVLLSLSIVYYNYSIGISEFSFSAFFSIFINTFCVGFLPITVVALLLYNYSLRKNLKEASELQELLDNNRENQVIPVSGQRIILMDSSGKELLNLYPDDLLMIRSADNYVDVFWKDQKSVKHTVLRQTIKQLEEQLATYRFFFRCHRTSIVNVRKILKITGNSIGCRLRLDDLEEEIPVSRGNRQQLLELLTLNSAYHETVN
ncbi:MAG: LytR/AlgR family response regulator transcription factor, partial [Flavobacteriales bacterium]